MAISIRYSQLLMECVLIFVVGEINLTLHDEKLEILKRTKNKSLRGLNGSFSFPRGLYMMLTELMQCV